MCCLVKTSTQSQPEPESSATALGGIGGWGLLHGTLVTSTSHQQLASSCMHAHAGASCMRLCGAAAGNIRHRIDC